MFIADSISSILFVELFFHQDIIENVFLFNCKSQVFSFLRYTTISRNRKLSVDILILISILFIVKTAILIGFLYVKVVLVQFKVLPEKLFFEICSAHLISGIIYIASEIPS